MLPHLRLDDLLAELQGRLQAVLGARDQMHGLLEAVVTIGAGLDLESTLRTIVRTAVGLVDASYGALGVIGEERQLAGFIPVGLTEDEISEIHHWPEGRGLLGLLIRDPRPLRLGGGEFPAAAGLDDDVAVGDREVDELDGGHGLPGVDDAADCDAGHPPQALVAGQFVEERAVGLHAAEAASR